MAPSTINQQCPGCSVKLTEPYIKCDECDSYCLCIHCFAKGFQSGNHQNDHSYMVLSYDFPVLEFGWSAAEELKLLDALSDCGPGNWSAIASQVESKSELECEMHYTKCYVVNAKYPFPDMPNPPIKPQATPIPFKASENPCRPLPDSHRAQNMAGYLAARGDFVEEFDNYAEWAVQDVYFSPDDRALTKSLKMSVVKIYQARLHERARRKHIIRKYGLIDLANYNLRYFRKLPNELKELEEKFRPLMQFQPHPISHDLMIQGLSAQLELRKKIEKLQDYRRNGITTKRVARLYEELKRERDETKVHSNFMSEILPHLHDPAALASWLHRQAQSDDSANLSSLPIIPTVKKPIPPIDISDLPGVEKLTTVEKEFCAKFRFVPEAFLSYKKSLVNEFQRNGPVKLATARIIVKIDVNKTRKLYDFLIEQGMIEKL